MRIPLVLGIIKGEFVAFSTVPGRDPYLIAVKGEKFKAAMAYLKHRRAVLKDDPPKDPGTWYSLFRKNLQCARNYISHEGGRFIDRAEAARVFQQAGKVA